MFLITAYYLLVNLERKTNQNCCDDYSSELKTRRLPRDRGLTTVVSTIRMQTVADHNIIVHIICIVGLHVTV